MNIAETDFLCSLILNHLTTIRMCIHSKWKELVTKMQVDSPACFTTTHYLRKASYWCVGIVKVQLQRVISCATGIELVVGNPYLLSNSGPEPAILDWHGHCSVNKVRGSRGMLPQVNFLN